jgi:uncharacterized membrane protein YkoI
MAVRGTSVEFLVDRYEGVVSMKRNTKIIAGVAIAAAAVAAGTGAAVAASTADDAEQPITGAALDEASAVALEHTGEGRVSETEVGDEDSYYEVEVTLDDGSQVDVQLDEQFNVVGDEVDDESEADDQD